MPKPCFLRDGSQLFGLDAELYFKAEASRDLAWETSLLEWVEKVISCRFEKTDAWACLKSGVVLCKLINGIKKGAIPRFAEQPAKKRTALHLLEEIDNIKLYLAACRALGLGATQLFDLEDLLKGRGMPQVMHNLYCVATLATQESENLSFDGPFFEAPKQVKRNRGATFLARVDRWNNGNKTSPRKDTLRQSPRKPSPTKALSPSKRTLLSPVKKQSRSVTIDMKEAVAMLDTGRTLHLLMEQRNPLCIVKKKCMFYRVKGATSNEDTLCWGSPWQSRNDKREADDSLRFDDFTAVVLGKLAKNFVSEAAKLAEPNCCFSLITLTRSLDLIADSCELRDLWLFGLGGILAQMNKHIALGEGLPEDKGEGWQRFFIRPVQKVELAPRQLDISQISLAYPDQSAVTELLANQSDKILSLEAKIASMTGNLTDLQLPRTLSLAVKEELQADPETSEALRRDGKAKQEELCNRLSTPQRRQEATLGLKLSSVHPIRYDIASPSVAPRLLKPLTKPQPPSSKPSSKPPVPSGKFTMRRAVDPVLLQLAELLGCPQGPELLPSCLSAAERLVKDLGEQTRKRRELQRHLASQPVRVLCRLWGAGQGGLKDGRRARVDIDGTMLYFDRIFGNECSQTDVFEELESLVDGCEEGKRACVFVTGLAGSGKSFVLQGTEQEAGLLPRAVEALLSGAGQLSAAHLHVFDNRMVNVGSQEPVLLEDKAAGLRCGDQIWTNVATSEQVHHMFSAQRPLAASSVIALRKGHGEAQAGYLVFAEVSSAQAQAVNDVFQSRVEVGASMLTALLHHFVSEEGSQNVLFTTLTSTPSTYELSCALQAEPQLSSSHPSLRRKLSSPRLASSRSPRQPATLRVASPRLTVSSPCSPIKAISSPCSPVKTQGDMELVKNLTALAKTANAENQRLENVVALQAARIQELEALKTPSLTSCTGTSSTIQPLHVSLSPLSEIHALNISPFDTLASARSSTSCFNSDTIVPSDFCMFPEGQDLVIYHTLPALREGDTLPIAILNRMQQQASVEDLQSVPATQHAEQSTEPALPEIAAHHPLGALPHSILSKLSKQSPKAPRTQATTDVPRDPPFSSATIRKLFSPPKFPTLRPNNTLTPSTLRVPKKPAPVPTLRVAAQRLAPSKPPPMPEVSGALKRTREFRSPIKAPATTTLPSKARLTTKPPQPTLRPKPAPVAPVATTTVKRLKPEPAQKPKPFR